MCTSSTKAGDVSPLSKYGCTSLHSDRRFDFPLLHSVASFLYGQTLKFVSIKSEFECFLKEKKPGHPRQLWSRGPGGDADLREPGLGARRSDRRGRRRAAGRGVTSDFRLERHLAVRQQER